MILGGSSQLVSGWQPPIYKPYKGHLEGEQPYLEDLLTMVINHLLAGIITLWYTNIAGWKMDPDWRCISY